MIKNKFMVSAVIFLIIIFALWRGLRTDPHLVNSPLIGKKVPAFNLGSLDDPQIILTRQIFDGHVTLLNVFATWCYACKAEHSVLMDMKNVHHVRIIGVDLKDSRAKTLAWLKSSGNPYEEVVFDSQGKLSMNLGVYGTPETFIVDSNGVIRYKYVGPISPRIWNQKIKPALEKFKNA